MDIVKLLGGLASLGTLICFVVVVVRMFQAKQTGLGVVSIIGFPCLVGTMIALFVGWKNRTAWQLNKVMPVFTLLFAVTLVWIATNVKQGLEEKAEPNSEFESELEVPEISP
jgi:Ca2+/Na+ antiporter